MHEQKFIRKTIFLFCPSLLKNARNECSVASSDLNDLLTSLHNNNNNNNNCFFTNPNRKSEKEIKEVIPF